jgi:hypothetical protein
VPQTATTAEIRAAYHRLARLHHPDASGGDTSRMADLNRAWHTLSDPVRRHDYDRTLRAVSGSAAPPSTRTGDEIDEAELAAMLRPRRDPLRSYVDRPRFPWKFVLALVIAGTVGILIFGSFVKPAPEPPLNNIIGPGSCVTIDVRRGEVAQASCNAAHDAVVQVIVEFDAPCPNGTESYRDRQGLGDACVVRVAPAP